MNLRNETPTGMPPFKIGEPVDIEVWRRWEKQQSDQRLSAAMKLADEGLTNWDCLTEMLGSDERPVLLGLVWHRLPHEQLLIAICDAWTMAHTPERTMRRADWLEIFRAAGYHVDHNPAQPPHRVELWRGGTRKTRMAWTADRDRAEWFQHRWEHLDGAKPGKLWKLVVGPDRLLAHYHAAVRNEDEYVIDPTGIRPTQV